MGQFAIPGNLLPVLIIWTFAAFGTEALFAVSADEGGFIPTAQNVDTAGGTSGPSVEPVNTNATSVSVSGSGHTFLQFLTFTVPGTPGLLTLFLWMTIQLPWIIIILAFIVSVIPFT